MKKGNHKDKESKEKPVVERRDDESDNTSKFHEAERNDKEKEIRSKQVEKGDDEEKPVVERRDDESDKTREFPEAERNDKEKEIRN